MDAVLADYRTSPLPDREKALLSYVEKVNGRAAAPLRPEDAEEARAAGWTDEALYDAVTVCALFNFYNAWCDGTGVGDLPESVYALSGGRLASGGYVPPEGPEGERPGP